MRTISRHTGFFDLLDALTQPGCALCSLAARTRWRYLDSLAYENVNDPGVRAKLRASLGFCNRHAWYFVERVREVFGAAIIYRDVLHAIQRRAADRTSADPFIPSDVCVACAAERDVTDAAIHTLSEAIDEPDLRASLTASEGLCAPHLWRAIVLADGSVRPKLLRLISEIWASVADDPRRRRWRAAGASGTFGIDGVAVAVDRQGDVRAPAVAAEPFVCEVCSAVRADLDRGPAEWGQHEIGGRCNVHAWLPSTNADSSVYGRQMAEVLAQAQDLAALSPESFVTQAMRNLGLVHVLADAPVLPLRCAVCLQQAAVESCLCANAGGTLCLPHLRRARRYRGHQVVAPLFSTWHDLDHLLTEYIRKEDYRFRVEARGIEQNAPRWAISLIAGAPGIR